MLWFYPLCEKLILFKFVQGMYGFFMEQRHDQNNFESFITHSEDEAS